MQENASKLLPPSTPTPATYPRSTIFAAFLGGALIATVFLFSLVASKRLNAKSDEILAKFSERLDAKAADTSTQLSNYYRLQMEQFGSNSTKLSAEFTSATADASSQISNYYRLQAKHFDSNSATLSARFAENLSAKAGEVANSFRAQADLALTAKTSELMAGISNSLQTQFSSLGSAVQSVQADLARPVKERAEKQTASLAAAERYAKQARPDIAELCYLSAFKSSGGDAGPVLKQYLAWKEATLAAAPGSFILTNGPATLLALLETLDQALPEVQASPADMENTLATVSRIKKIITARQAAQIERLNATLAWDTFTPASLQAYVNAKNTLSSISPASPEIESARSKSQDKADNLIQTARALSPGILAELLPPSPQAPDSVQTNWYENAFLLLHQPTNQTDAKIAAFAVIHEYSLNNSNLMACRHYLPQLDTEATVLASAQWRDQQEQFTKVREAKPKADAETLAAGQALLSQGVSLVNSCSNKSLVAPVQETLPTLAKELSLHREQMLQDLIKALPSASSPETKEERARARSMVVGQLISATMELRSVQQDLQKLGCTTSVSGSTTELLVRLEGYLTAFAKEDAGAVSDDRATRLEEERQQRARYANYAERQIYFARTYYDQAKNLADQWLTTWSNDQVQAKLRAGLSTLYAIDCNDLNRANPGIAMEWSTVETNLKKEFAGSASAVNAETPKKSIIDF